MLNDRRVLAIVFLLVQALTLISFASKWITDFGESIADAYFPPPPVQHEIVPLFPNDGL